MAALTVTRVASFVDRQKAAMIVGYVDLATGTGHYQTGGWDLTKASVNPNITTIYSYQFLPIAETSPNVLVWDHANGKVLVYVAATGVQLADEEAGMDSKTIRLRYEAV